MPITRITKHDTHNVRLSLTKNGSVHYAALRCVDCNKHIQWLSKPESLLLMNQGVDFKSKRILTCDELGI